MKKRPPRDYLLPADDDGLLVADVGPWAAEKYRRMGMYAEIFSTGMKNQFPTRVYIDLFAGPGHAMLRESRKRVLTSPLLALSVPDQFSKYVFSDANPDLIEVLKVRAKRLMPEASTAFVVGDANERVDEITSHIPPHSAGGRVLSFCFVDPFGLDIHFDTVRRLGQNRAMDFLILLALGVDANRNWATYLRPANRKVENFLGDSTWRNRWTPAQNKGVTPIRFLAEEYASAMSKLDYLTTSIDRMIEVKTYENNMRLYYLAFFSKHERGYQFWREVQKYSTDQLGLL